MRAHQELDRELEAGLPHEKLENLASNRVRVAFEHPEWYLERREYNIRIRAETVQEFTGNVNCERILDIGCGDGSLSLPLLSGQRCLTLLDLSSRMLAIARARVPSELSPCVETINDGFLEASLEPKSYDLVICVGVLAYVSSVRDLVAKIVSLLRPNGNVIVECTDSRHWLSYANRAHNWLCGVLREPRCRLLPKSSQDVVASFKNYGFKVVGVYRYSLGLPGIDRWIRQDCLHDMVRFVYGTSKRNSRDWMGNECIYHFRRLDN